MTDLHPIMDEALRPFMTAMPTKLFNVKSYEVVNKKINVVISKGIKALAPVYSKPDFECWLKRSNRIETTIPQYWIDGNVEQDLYDYIVIKDPLNNPFHQ